jgi:hypothetical protein
MTELTVNPKLSPSLIETYAFERGLWNRWWFIIMLCAAFAGLDWELISQLIFPFVFVFPLMLAAWNRGITFTLFCAAGLALTRFGHHYFFYQQHFVHRHLVDFWDDVDVGEVASTLIQFFVLALLAFLTTLLSRQSRQLRQRVRALEGMLPICSFCKSIRDDKGEWIRVENYISDRSAATFTHSLCPECTQKNYGEFLKGKRPK